jgi:hypothetical protein
MVVVRVTFDRSDFIRSITTADGSQSQPESSERSWGHEWLP